MFFKLLMVGIILGVGAYYYDMNSAETKIHDAEFSSRETEMRCENQHESMCKYYMTVKLPREKLFYKFRVPLSFFHAKTVEQLKSRKYPVMYKSKKIFPARIVDLEPKFKAQLEKELSADK